MTTNTALSTAQKSIKIVIAEPWDLGGTTLYGTILRRLQGPDDQTYLLIRLTSPDTTRLQLEGAVISNRFTGHTLDDLLHGKEIDVGIAKIVDNVLYDQEHFSFDQVQYCAIGTAVLVVT